MAAPKPLCPLRFVRYQCTIILLWYRKEFKFTSACTLAIYNPHVLDKRQRRSEKDGMFSKSCPWCQWEYSSVAQQTIWRLHHPCQFITRFNHYIVYEVVLKGEGSFVQVLCGKIFSFFEMVKYVSIPRSVYSFDNCHLIVYWDPLEFKLLREVY